MKLFISYRRRSWGSVHLLADKLKAKIKSDIFVDYENIDDTDFERSILRHLRESDIVLVVVTEYTFSHERIHNENDWVRREIALALELGKPILLVLIDNLSPPSPSDLPKDIRDITHMHGIPFYPEYFDEAVQKLAKAVTTALATISSSQIINSPEQVNDNIVPQSNVSQLSSLTKTNYSDVPQNTTGELQEYKQYNMEANALQAIDKSSAIDLPLEIYIENAQLNSFWLYFVSQALRLSLKLICNDIPNTDAALILPLERDTEVFSDPVILPRLKEALIGWMSPDGSFIAFIKSNPSFEYPSDFRIVPLLAIEGESVPADNTIIVLQRKSRNLKLSLTVVQTVRHLLTLVYKNIEYWRSAFGYGMRDYLYQATNFSIITRPSDDILDRLMNIVIQIGGPSAVNLEQNRWRFCCLLLPLQNQTLIVRAQSERSPHLVGITTVFDENLALSLRAYQSGTIIYRPDIAAKNVTIGFQEQFSHSSAIAIPIASEEGLSIAVLYIASDEAQAFPKEDQRVLRLIGIMVKELLLTYEARQQITKITDLIDNSDIVDPAFKDFLTENDFMRDLEKLLLTVKSKEGSEYAPDEEVSIIAIDIDNQSALATRYGNHIVRNLSREVGIRVRGQLNLFFGPQHQRLYHISAGSYYLLLEGMFLDEARRKAEQLRIALSGYYLIDTQRDFRISPKLLESMLELPDITVRLGISAYKFIKLKEILGRLDSEVAIFETRTRITQNIDEVLKQGNREGGNVIISWDPKEWNYIKWLPKQDW